ncbi:MAG: hypothetical protein H5U40_16190 [Polyangiaceae bacterium]|nr:hypothetical protein [Polyangiaceae bacterium]
MAPELPAEGEAPREFDVFEAAAAQSAPWAEVIWDSPYRRPLAAANAIVSAMLLIGSFLLTFRRKSALWWIKNSIAANVLYIFADFSHKTVRLVSAGPQLYAKIEAYARVYEGLGAHVGGRAVVIQAIVIAGIIAMISATIHLAIVWRAHRPDIRAFLESDSRS